MGYGVYACAGGGFPPSFLPPPPLLPPVSLVDDGSGFFVLFWLWMRFYFFLALQVQSSMGVDGVGACHFTVMRGYIRREKGRASGSHSQGL